MEAAVLGNLGVNRQRNASGAFQMGLTAEKNASRAIFLSDDPKKNGSRATILSVFRRKNASGAINFPVDRRKIALGAIGAVVETGLTGAMSINILENYMKRWKCHSCICTFPSIFNNDCCLSRIHDQYTKDWCGRGYHRH